MRRRLLWFVDSFRVTDSPLRRVGIAASAVFTETHEARSPGSSPFLLAPPIRLEVW